MRTAIIGSGFRAAAVATTLLLLTGCGDSTPTQVEPAIHATESSIFLGVGQTQSINVTVVPAGAAFEASSDDTEKATVTQTASSITITGHEVGFATVMLVMVEYPWVWYDITVEVTP